MNVRLGRYLKNDCVWGLLMITLIVVIFFFPVVVGKQTLFPAYPIFYEKVPGRADSPNYHYAGIRTPWVADPWTPLAVTTPQTIEAVDMLHRGIVPLWTPYEEGGQPLLANLASGLYNPLRLVYFYFFDSLRAFDIFLLLRLIATGFGIFLLLKALGLKKSSALLGSVAYMFAGVFIDNVTIWFNDIFAALPYLFWAAEKYFEARKLAFIGWSGLFFALLILGSHPEITIICGLFFVSYFLFKMSTEPNAREYWLKDFRNLALIVLLGSLIGSPLVVDLYNFISVGYPYHWAPVAPPATNSSIPLIYLTNLVVSPLMFTEVAIAGGITRNTTASIHYVGLAVLVLLILALTAKPRHKAVKFFGFAALISVMVLWEMPPFNLIRYIPHYFGITYSRLFGILPLCASVLAAFGYEQLRSLESLPRKFWLAVAAIPAIFASIFLVFRQTFSAMFVPYFDFAKNGAAFEKLLTRLPGVLSGLVSFLLHNGVWVTILMFTWFTLVYCLILLFIYKYVKTKKSFYLTAILVLLAIELWTYMPKIRDGFNPQNPYTPPPYLGFLLSHTDENVRVISTNRTFTNNLGDLFKIQQFFGAGAVYPKRWWNFIQADTYLVSDINRNLTDEAVAKIPQSFFDAGNIKYILTEAYLSPRPNFKLVYDKDIKIYENKNVLPRAYMVYSAISASSTEAARNIFYSDSELNYKTGAVLENTQDLSLNNAPGAKGAAQITKYQENEVDLSVSTDQKGILVLADSFYPGWKAYVNGAEAKIYPVNIMFRGIILYKGSYNVKFIYEPPWLWPTVTISLIATVTCLLFIFFKTRIKQNAA